MMHRWKHLLRAAHVTNVGWLLQECGTSGGSGVKTTSTWWPWFQTTTTKRTDVCRGLRMHQPRPFGTLRSFFLSKRSRTCSQQFAVLSSCMLHVSGCSCTPCCALERTDPSRTMRTYLLAVVRSFLSRTVRRVKPAVCLGVPLVQ
jgi:hypothetical protein